MNVLREAYAAHQRGRLAEAERGYLAALQQSPDEVDALHLLGLLRHQQGRHTEAVDLLKRAVALRPRFAGAHLNLGNAWKALKRFDEAQASYRAALAAQPDMAHAHFNLANTLVTLEQHEEAIDHFEQAVRLQPNHAAAFNNLGNSLAALKRHEAAAGAFYKAIQLQPGYAGAHNNLGLALNALERHDEALDHFRAALASEPNFTLARFNLGSTLDKLNRAAEAIEPLERVARDQPAFAPGHYALGNAYANAGRLDDARARLEEAVALDPSFALAWQDLGTVAYDLGDYTHAADALEHATQWRPDLALAQYNLGLVALMNGAFERGFDAYEWRWNVWPRPVVDAPAWRGGPLPGDAARLLIHAEQGLGDTLQFVRYVPRVAALGARVVLEVQPSLVRLLGPSAEAWGIELIARGAKRPPVDAECPLLSLPLALRTRPDTIPHNVPYLMAPGLAPAFDDAGRRRVGLVWSGAVRARRETRAIPVGALAPLLAIDGIEWVVLQPDIGDADRDALAAWPSVRFAPTPSDFADTADTIAGLDLVVTIDTSVAHLAGAMGRPVWIMLPKGPDWRWGASAATTPWYPSARLFRQTRASDWSVVVAHVAAALCADRAS
ncbi:tetratricopeptide repeat protein [Pararobbsia silviterrae]|uniref:Tetratricopeptide repeat protein n=1 Tax=Pararobbsia silviterrae TaxID=1792498 RepID=A0A494YGT0_9BURK|nr:tetratricopeptide repeat protein [Pararobbsia silviterrae]RKP59237.1 tetratricopeptide repeat protein [Pararobbsia silviterrae]